MAFCLPDILRQQSCLLVWCAGQIKDSDTATIFKLIGSGVGLKSLNYSLTATHVDDTAKNGTWLGGDTHNGVETLGVEFVGKAESDDMTLSEDWDVTELANGDIGTAGDTSSISMTRGVATDDDGEAATIDD